MSMNGPGMWMPKQKSGKNWIVDYSVTVDGENKSQNRKFRVRADAYEFIEISRQVFERNPSVADIKFKVSKI